MRDSEITKQNSRTNRNCHLKTKLEVFGAGQKRSGHYQLHRSRKKSCSVTWQLTYTPPNAFLTGLNPTQRGVGRSVSGNSGCAFQAREKVELGRFQYALKHSQQETAPRKGQNSQSSSLWHNKLPIDRNTTVTN